MGEKSPAVKTENHNRPHRLVLDRGSVTFAIVSKPAYR